MKLTAADKAECILHTVETFTNCTRHEYASMPLTEKKSFIIWLATSLAIEIATREGNPYRILMNSEDIDFKFKIRRDRVKAFRFPGTSIIGLMLHLAELNTCDERGYQN